MWMFFISLFSMFVQLKQSTLKPGLVLCLRSIQKRNGLNVATKILSAFPLLTTNKIVRYENPPPAHTNTKTRDTLSNWLVFFYFIYYVEHT